MAFVVIDYHVIYDRYALLWGTYGRLFFCPESGVLRDGKMGSATALRSSVSKNIYDEQVW
jgi:hypothetical protein